MKKRLTFCRRVVLPVALVLAVWYFTQVAPAQNAPGNDAPQSTAGQMQISPDAAAPDADAPDAAALDANAPDTSAPEAGTPAPEANSTAAALDENGSYTARDDVALYLVTYGRLPNNFITKREAEKLGWDSHAGNLNEVAPNKSIGGDHYGNYEGGLPGADGRKWHECDIGYSDGYRSAQRILYSNDGLVYYTNDHYKTFTQLY